MPLNTKEYKIIFRCYSMFRDSLFGSSDGLKFKYESSWKKSQNNGNN